MNFIFSWLTIPHNDRSIEDFEKTRLIFYGAVLTSPLMFAYAWVAQNFMSISIAGRVGWLCSIVHLFSPLLLRFTRNHLFVISILLFAGFLHQATFAFYSGGFQSSILIWFAVLPVIAAVVSGWKGTVLWAGIAFFATCIFAAGEILNFPFPTALNTEEKFLAQSLISFGMICLNAFLIYLFLQYSNASKNELKVKNNSISDLLRILIHDISNPLMSANIRLKNLKIEPLTQGQGLNLEKALKSINSINEITQATRAAYLLENDPLKLNFQDVIIEDMMKDVLDGFDHALAAKKIKVELKSLLSPDFKIHINVTAFKHQLLANLISNAIKYSDEKSSILINLKNENNYLIISIQDFGIGMAQATLENLFNVEYNKQRQGTMGEQGTGFGIHLANKTALAHKGRIEVESKEKQGFGISGTIFNIFIPIQNRV